MLTRLLVLRPRRGLRQGGWVTLGAAAVLLPFGGLYLTIYGLHPTPYMTHSGALGFRARGLLWKAYTLLIEPRPFYPDGAGLLERLPWLVPGVAGLLAVPWLPTGPRRSAGALLTLLLVPYAALYLSYVDLIPSGLWDFGNIHYFKWTLPGFLLLGVLVVQALLAGPHRRAVAIACAAGLLPLCLRLQAVPAPLASDTAWMIQYPRIPASAFDPYFSHFTVRDALGPLANIRDMRTMDDAQGIRLVAGYRPFAGHPAFAGGDGAPDVPSPASLAEPNRRWGISIRLSYPCWLPRARCDRLPDARRKPL